MAFAIEAKAKGDEDKIANGLRQLQEEDPTIDLHRDDATGEQIVAGLTQIHVEVVLGRLKERFGVEVELHPPRVPYLETIRSESRAQGRYKKQTGGRGDYSMHFLRYEEVPTHVAQKVIEETRKLREAAHA
jgi:elongation factor G